VATAVDRSRPRLRFSSDLGDDGDHGGPHHFRFIAEK